MTSFGLLYSTRKVGNAALSLIPMRLPCGDSFQSPGKPQRQTFLLLLTDDCSWPAAQEFLILCEEHLIGTRPDLFQLLIEPI